MKKRPDYAIILVVATAPPDRPARVPKGYINYCIRGITMDDNNESIKNSLARSQNIGKLLSIMRSVLRKKIEQRISLFKNKDALIRVRYSVSHSKFGLGIITGINNLYVSVLFDSDKLERTFNFPSAFKAGYLLPEDRELKLLLKTIFENPGLLDFGDIIYDDYLYSLIREYEDYNLSEIGKKELYGFFSYLRQNKMKGIPYHFLIRSETDKQGTNFAMKLAEHIKEFKGNHLKTETMPERLLFSGAERCKNADIVIVNDPLANDRYYLNDNLSASEISKREEYNHIWDMIMKFFGNNPSKVFIMVAPNDIIQGRIRKNPDMYYRFFRHRIYIGDMSVETIYERMMKKINATIPGKTASFEEDFREYIYTVYPRADLKGEEFIEDLFQWMISNTFQHYGNCNYFSRKSIPYYIRNESYEQLELLFDQLVGLENVKETLHDIGLLCHNIENGEKAPFLHMAFKGNPGTGKTTVARFVARLLSSMHVIKRNIVVEVMTSDLLGQYLGQTAPKVESKLKEAEGGILFIDEAYLLNPSTGVKSNSYREECIGTLIKGMEARTNPVIIFAGYPDEMDELLKSNPGLRSRIGYVVDFEDYSDDQLVEIFVNRCVKEGYDYNEQTLEAVKQKITALRYEDSFGNARTVENIFSQAVIECLRADAESRMILAEHIKIRKDIRSYEELQEELDSKVGIVAAKKIITEQVLSNRFCKEQKKKLPSSNNMVFVGNPGTGKTTIAKLFSELLFSVGVAKSPRTKMVSAKDLYAQNVAEKMNEICRETMGGVLFIDEIYMLQSTPYVCTEVVSVLLDILENKKEDLTVILAGYEKEMEQFLQENPGLRSRFPITVHFDDFNKEELYQIFEQNCADGGMKVDPEAKQKFEEVIELEMKKDNFSNGRTVRNIYEQAFRNHAVHFYSGVDSRSDCIAPKDIEESVNIDSKPRVIGFGK